MFSSFPRDPVGSPRSSTTILPRARLPAGAHEAHCYTHPQDAATQAFPGVPVPPGNTLEHGIFTTGNTKTSVTHPW